MPTNGKTKTKRVVKTPTTKKGEKLPKSVIKREIKKVKEGERRKAAVEADKKRFKEVTRGKGTNLKPANKTAAKAAKKDSKTTAKKTTTVTKKTAPKAGSYKNVAKKKTGSSVPAKVNKVSTPKKTNTVPTKKTTTNRGSGNRARKKTAARAASGKPGAGKTVSYKNVAPKKSGSQVPSTKVGTTPKSTGFLSRAKGFAKNIGKRALKYGGAAAGALALYDIGKGAIRASQRTGSVAPGGIGLAGRVGLGAITGYKASKIINQSKATPSVSPTKVAKKTAAATPARKKVTTANRLTPTKSVAKTTTKSTPKITATPLAKKKEAPTLTKRGQRKVDRLGRREARLDRRASRARNTKSKQRIQARSSKTSTKRARVYKKSIKK